jgi:polar amino acid transport system substrate-binding protein
MSRFRLALVTLLAATAIGGAIGRASAAELPDAIRKAGTFNLAINSTYAPMEFHDPATNELKGLDIDLAQAIARRLGVTITWTDVPFEQLVPALTTGRTDFILSGFSDRASRRETMDFVDYLGTGPQFFVLDVSAVRAPQELCGLKVGTVRSTSFPAEVEKWSKAQCQAVGRPAVQYVAGENSIDVRNQLKQGRIEAAVQGSETLPYAQSNEPGRYRIVGAPIGQGYQGIAFRKDAGPLRAAVTAALAGMIADGTYAEILAKWGLSANAVAEPMLNASPQ